MHNRGFFLAVSLALFCLSASAQKKDLTPADYGKWQSLNATALSPDGAWAAWRITVEQDNDTTYLTNRTTRQTYKLAFASLPDFSGDNNWVAYSIGLPYKEAEKLREQSKPVESNKMGLLNLRTGKTQVFENIARYQFSRDGKFLAIALAPAKDSKEKGNVLLVRNLTDSSSRTIGNVTNYAFNKNSDQLAYIVETGNKAGNSVELYNLKTSVLKVLASDTSRFTGLQWQKEGDGLAFYKVFSDTAFEEEAATVYVYANNPKATGIKVFNPAARQDFPAGKRIYSGSSITLSNDFNKVFFGLKDWTVKPSKNNKKTADTAKSKTPDSTAIAAAPKPADKTAGVDIWHWKDPEIQPRQKVTYNRDKEESLLAVWNINTDKFFQLAKDTIPLSSVTGDQAYVILSTAQKYKPAFKEDYADVYLVNAGTGQQKLLIERAQAGYYTSPQSSPDGKYLAWFKDKNWWVMNTATGASVNVTTGIKSDFWNTRDDHPATKPPFGMGGWTKGDKELFVYDEFDIWAIKPDGKGARKLTDGKKDKIIYRVNRLEYENPYLDDTRPLYFSAYGDTSKYFGYARYEKGKVSPVIYENQMVNRLVKAKDSDAFLYVKQRYDLSPELYVTTNFSQNEKLVTTNPQQAGYKWGKSELVNFTNAKGKPMQGALFYPADYEPGKKYPMIVYIYENLSNTVHMYSNPSERSAYNTTNFTTAGYFVFRPDIVYDINEPGMSAVNCVVPAVQEVIKTGMIDTAKVGLMGHSWGAYQTSFIITQTDIFKAACAGAPLTDLISMSMSIYWNSGTPDQKIFETSQGRFDGPWYDRMEEHMRNSPMFNAARIKAPLLVAFGDKDGAVDWHQGIEMYGTMRRMEKPHIMLVYADENHGLAKKENQIDYQKRQKAFFDHFLLKKPAEKWITDGISYQQKMKEKEKPDQPKQAF
ncbi:MAG: S9 family peptidase [Chitinophagaceae bacterium]|nr:MAG: S9 family peptidase [Chitinophagaceae bacterium]